MFKFINTVLDALLVNFFEGTVIQPEHDFEHSTRNEVLTLISSLDRVK